MAKFKIGDVLQPNEWYKSEYRRIFKKEPKKNKGGKVLGIWDNGIDDPVYFFTEVDETGNAEGMAEQFLELK